MRFHSATMLSLGFFLIVVLIRGDQGTEEDVGKCMIKVSKDMTGKCTGLPFGKWFEDDQFGGTLGDTATSAACSSRKDYWETMCEGDVEHRVFWLPKKDLNMEANVVALSNSNLQEFLNETEHAMVDFYAPWCGHCKNLEPEWEKAGEMLRSENSSIRLAKMDTDSEKNGNAYVSGGYPTIIYFENGKKKEQVEFPVHSSVYVLEYAHKIESASMKVLKEVDVEKYLDGIRKPGIFALVARVKENSVRAKAFLTARQEILANNWTQGLFRMAVVWLPKSADPKKDASLFMWRPGFKEPDAEKLQFEGSWTSSNIMKWSRDGLFGTVNQFFRGELWTGKMTEGMDGLVTALVDDELLRPNLEKQLSAFSQGNTGWQSMILNIGNVESPVLEYLNPRNLSTPLISAITWQKMKQYFKQGGEEIAKADSIQSFLEDVRGNLMNTNQKSGVAPKFPTDSGGMTTLVSDTFDKIVLDPKKAVFVNYADAKCEYCKQLEPIWKNVAKKLQKVPNVVIAKMDVDHNSYEESLIKLPTLMLYPAVEKARKFKERMILNGPWTEDKIISFLSDNVEGVHDEL